MFRISRFRTTDIHRSTERLGQLLGIKIVFPSKLTMFDNILISIYINYENENCVKTTVANQCTWVRNQLYTFLSLVNKDLPVNYIVFKTNIYYL